MEKQVLNIKLDKKQSRLFFKRFTDIIKSNSTSGLQTYTAEEP